MGQTEVLHVLRCNRNSWLRCSDIARMCNIGLSSVSKSLLSMRERNEVFYARVRNHKNIYLYRYKG